MIEIVITNGDRAEAETPEDAVIAARTLINDATEAGEQSRLLSAAFFVGGYLVRSGFRRSDLSVGSAR